MGSDGDILDNNLAARTCFATVGTSSLNTISSTSRLILPVL